MSSIFPLYASFSILCLFLKVVIVWLYRAYIAFYSTWAKALLLSLFSMNLLEFVGYYYPMDGKNALLLLSLYYISVISAGGTILGLSLLITERLSRAWLMTVLLTLAITETASLVPGVVLNGVSSVGYSLTRVPGPYYWLFQVAMLFFLCGGALVLVQGALTNRSAAIRRKAKALLIALAPLLITSVAVIVLMQLGFKITNSVVGSLAILVFLLILLATENAIIADPEGSDGKLFRFLSYLPATEEFKLATRVRQALWINRLDGLHSTVTEFERMIISEALALGGGNKSSTAELLGISRASLRRKLNTSGIQPSDTTEQDNPRQ